MRYWLLKSEPTSFSWDDLWHAKGRTTRWDGVRNYQARNFMREMRRGDRALFYHSSAEPNGVFGIVEVVREAYADPTQFDAGDDHYDAKSRREEPAWSAVDIRAVEPLRRPVTLAELRADAALAGMVLLRKGSRLSITPVDDAEWNTVLRMGGSSSKGPSAAR